MPWACAWTQRPFRYISIVTRRGKFFFGAVVFWGKPPPLVGWCCEGSTRGGGARGGRLLGPGTRLPPPPPLPALRANLVAKGQQLLAIHIVAPKAPENFFSFPLPILSTLHPNIILEPNLDSNAHPNPQPTPNPTPKPFP